MVKVYLDNNARMVFMERWRRMDYNVSKDDSHCRLIVDLVCTWKYLKETVISCEQMSYLKTEMGVEGGWNSTVAV